MGRHCEPKRSNPEFVFFGPKHKEKSWIATSAFGLLATTTRWFGHCACSFERRLFALPVGATTSKSGQKPPPTLFFPKQRRFIMMTSKVFDRYGVPKVPFVDMNISPF